MFAIDPLDFVLEHPEANIKLDIIWFCLEESKIRFILSFMCAWLQKHTDSRIDIKHLLSYGDLLPQRYIDELRPAREHFKKIESMMHIYDNVKNPYGIFKTVEKFMEAHGTWTMKWIDIVDDDSGSITPKQVRDTYSTNHPEHYVEVVVDHLSLIHPEKSHENSLHKAIQQLSSNYFLVLRDKYYCSIVAVQQQSAESEKQQYTFKGQSIESKLEPSLAGLGDNKLTGRDANEVYGLFAPDRYEIPNHRGYDVQQLEDNYRSLVVLKHRDGESNIRIGLFFDGATNHFEELPLVDQMIDDMYVQLLARVDRVPTLNFIE